MLIQGTDLTGATSVTFGGIPATFTVLEPTVIEATISSGAKSGKWWLRPLGARSRATLFEVL